MSTQDNSLDKANTERNLFEELEKILTPERISRIDSILDSRTNQITLILDNITHLHNVSAVIRTAEAFGLTDIHLINDRQILSDELSDGISLGTEKWINVYRHKTSIELVQELKTKGFSLVALLPPDKNSSSIPVSLLPFEKPLALMFGNEVNGLGAKLIEAADILAYIPMKGFVESLNISVACAITLFCSTIEKAAPASRTQQLDPKIKNEIRKEWIKKSIQNVDIVERNLKKRL